MKWGQNQPVLRFDVGTELYLFSTQEEKEEEENLKICMSSYNWNFSINMVMSCLLVYLLFRFFPWTSEIHLLLTFVILLCPFLLFCGYLYFLGNFLKLKHFLWFAIKYLLMLGLLVRKMESLSRKGKTLRFYSYLIWCRIYLVFVGVGTFLTFAFGHAIPTLPFPYPFVLELPS